jgi:DnaJ-class molecular chaperone
MRSDCTSCQGHGVVQTVTMGMCGSCNGSKSINRKLILIGSGWDDTYGSDRCCECRGSGREDTPKYEDCGACWGKGEISIPENVSRM